MAGNNLPNSESVNWTEGGKNFTNVLCGLLGRG